MMSSVGEWRAVCVYGEKGVCMESSVAEQKAVCVYGTQCVHSKQ